MTLLAERLTWEEIRIVLGKSTLRGSIDEAVRELAEAIRVGRVRADLLGRTQTLKAADALVRAGSVSPVPPPVPLEGAVGAQLLPRVPFTDAVADVLARDPRLASGFREVAEAYNTDHVFSLARSSSVKVTPRVQQAVADAIQRGETVSGAARDIQAIAKAAGEDMAKWTRNYAETVAQTNFATAHSAGRFRQMADPAVRYAIGALEIVGPTDSTARPNHRAAVGLVASPEWGGWHRMAPPLGYACRHSLRYVGWPELERMGRVQGGRVTDPVVPSGAGPDEGFEHYGRPDVAIYGGRL